MRLSVDWTRTDEPPDMNRKPTETEPSVTTVRLQSRRDGQLELKMRSVTWQVIDGPDQGRVFVIEGGAVRIGTASDNTLTLTDPSVSRHHAEVMELRSGFLVRDLESTNGTFLDRHRVNEAFLSPGDPLRVGNTTLRCEPRSDNVIVRPADAESCPGLVGKSLAMRQLYGVIKRLAPTALTLIIRGETGTGKEQAARAIHAASPRAAGPFVVLDCSAVDKELLSAELFGNEVGAYTGATTARPGVFEQADGGTLFIDELGELPLDFQPKLLRALERREAKRLGGTRVQRFDCRVIAATHRPLDEMVLAGEFREDLYYRLAQATLFVPAVRERQTDVALLAEAFRVANVGETGRPRSFAPDALAALATAELRGNVRELKNIVERACALAEGDAIREVDLALPAKRPPVAPSRAGGTSASGAVARPPAPVVPADISFDGEETDDEPLTGGTLDAAERDAIMRALKSHNYHRARAAAELGVSLPRLRRQIKRHGIRVPERGEADE